MVSPACWASASGDQAEGGADVVPGVAGFAGGADVVGGVFSCGDFQSSAGGESGERVQVGPGGVGASVGGAGDGLGAGGAGQVEHGLPGQVAGCPALLGVVVRGGHAIRLAVGWEAWLGWKSGAMPVPVAGW